MLELLREKISNHYRFSFGFLQGVLLRCLLNSSPISLAYILTRCLTVFLTMTVAATCTGYLTKQSMIIPEYTISRLQKECREGRVQYTYPGASSQTLIGSLRISTSTHSRIVDCLLPP